MATYFLKKFILFSLTVLVSKTAFSQSNDSINRLNRKYQKEIGIDLQGLFLKTLSTSLIFKSKDNSGRFVELTSSKNYRFQLGLSGTIPISEKTKALDTSVNRFASQDARTFSIQAMIGKERVKFYGRFNFYYGYDIGPYYLYSYSGYTVTTYSYQNYGGSSWITNNNNYPWLQSETTKIGLGLAPFIGAKYRFSEHFSASMESSFFLSYFFSRTKLSSLPNVNNANSASTNVADKRSSGLEFYVKYIRFLTINYHL